MTARTRFSLRRLASLLLAGLILGLAVIWFAGSYLISTSNSALPSPEPGTRPIALRTGSGAEVGGWLLQGKGQGAVLLLHGIHADRRQMLNRAHFLNRLGYSVLLIDLPGHGASPAPYLSFGLNESHAVKAALIWMHHHFPHQPVGLIGASLGAASFALCTGCPRPDAVVLESMYPTIEEAVDDRLRKRVNVLAAPLSKALLAQLPLRLGIEPGQLHPIEHMAALDMPVLVAAGTADEHTTIGETRRIYAALGGEKQLWEVPGAGHVDLHGYARAEYERRIGAFFMRHMAAPTMPAR